MGAPHHSPDCQSSCNVRKKMGVGETEDDRGIVIEDECELGTQNLGGRLVLMLMSTGIVVGEVLVVAVGVRSFEKRCLSVTEVECLEVDFGLVGGDIFDLGGDFVAVVVEMEVEELELEIGAVVRLVWGCLNGRMYFLRRVSRMSLEGCGQIF